MEYKDYYKILGVSRDADDDEIKRAYRKLARKYHPDVSQEADAEQHFKEISEAYEVLRDPEKRAAYDQLGSGWREGQDFRPPPEWEVHAGGAQGRAGGAADFSDFFESLFGQRGSPFEDMFGGSMGGGRQRSGFAARGQDQTARITVNLEDAYHGSTRTVQLEGAEPDESGQMRRRQRSLRVRVPAGVTNGQRIRLTGQGQPGMGGGPRGDLYLEVHISPHRHFHLRGADIHLELPLAPWEAALGTRLKVPTLGGEVDMRIPEGSQSGRRLRLKGRGLPSDPAGDQYVTLRIVNPPVDERMRRLFEQMREHSSFDPRAELRR